MLQTTLTALLTLAVFALGYLFGKRHNVPSDLTPRSGLSHIVSGDDWITEDATSAETDDELYDPDDDRPSYRNR